MFSHFTENKINFNALAKFKTDFRFHTKTTINKQLKQKKLFIYLFYFNIFIIIYLYLKFYRGVNGYQSCMKFKRVRNKAMTVCSSGVARKLRLGETVILPPLLES